MMWNASHDGRDAASSSSWPDSVAFFSDGKTVGMSHRPAMLALGVALSAVSASGRSGAFHFS